MASRYSSYVCLIVLSMCCSALYAQVPWSSYYTTTGDSLTATDPVQLVQAANGDLVVVCRMADLPLHEHVRFLRMAADGTLISAREYVFTTGAFIYTLAELADGRFVATGGERTTNDAVMLVLGPTGDLQSCRTLQLGSTGNITAVLPEPDTTLTASFWINVGGYKALTARFQPDAAQVTATNVLIDASPGGLSVNAHCADGGTYHGGAIYPTGTSEINLSLARTDIDGNVQWAEHLLAAGLTYMQGMAELPDGGALVGGTFAPTPGDGYPFILRTDVNGAPLWMKYLMDTTGVSTGWAVRTTELLSPDTFLLIGKNEDSHAFRIAVDTAGNVLFADTWPEATYFGDVQQAPNGDVLLTMGGATPNSTGLSPGVLRMHADLAMDCAPTPVDLTGVALSPTVANTWSATTLTIPWLDITASITQTTPSITPYDPCIQTVAAEHITEAPLLRAWPVPAADHVLVTGPRFEQLDVIDATGRVVLTRAFSATTFQELDVRAWASGLYHVRVRDHQRWYAVALVKE